MGKSFAASIVLIFLGTIFLLNNFGILPWDIWEGLWKFWPVILILVGLEFVLGRQISWKLLLIVIFLVFGLPSLLSTNPFSKDFTKREVLPIEEKLGTLIAGKVDIDLGVTNLNIVPLASQSAQIVKGEAIYPKAIGRLEKEFKTEDGRGILKIKGSFNSNVPLVKGTALLNLNLTMAVPFEMDIKLGAGLSNFDLSNLQITKFEIDSGVSNINIKFPEKGVISVIISGGAANITIEIPTSLAAKISTQDSLKSLNINEERFKKKNGAYISENFDKATDKLELELKTAVASVTIK